MVREGRVLIRHVQLEGVPSLSFTTILRDAVDKEDQTARWGDSVDFSSDRIERTTERSICILQMILHCLFERVWFECWDRLLDEIDDSISLQVGCPFFAHCHNLELAKLTHAFRSLMC